MKRPPHRHHSRSHSSDTLVTMSSTSSSLSSSASSNTSSSTLYHPSSRPPIYNRHSKSSKMTPDYIFVQPASPGPDEMPPKTSSSTVVTTNGHASAPQDASNGYYHSMPSSSARHYSYSHSPSSSSSPPSSSRPSLRRSSYTRQSASAVFDQHQNHHAYSYGSTTSAGDDGDVPPPRSSSHSNLSQASANATSHRRSNRRGMSASADSSPRHSISISPLPRINDDEQQVPMRSDNTVSAPVTPAHARFAMSSKKGDIEDSKAPRSHSMQTSFSDSALATSSSSADSSFNNSSESESESKASRAALSSPLLQKHKPSWGEIPTPTSMNSSTAFSFGQQKSNPSTSSSMDVTTPTALTNGASDQAGRAEIGSGSSTPTPKAEMEDPVALKKTNTAQPSTNINGGEPFF